MPRADDRATLERLLKKNAEQRGTIEYLKLQNEALDEKDFVGRRGKEAKTPKSVSHIILVCIWSMLMLFLCSRIRAH